MLSNNNVIALSKWTEEKFNVEVFPADKGWDHSIHEVKEITLIKFYYPLIMIIKG